MTARATAMEIATAVAEDATTVTASETAIGVATVVVTTAVMTAATTAEEEIVTVTHTAAAHVHPPAVTGHGIATAATAMTTGTGVAAQPRVVRVRHTSGQARRMRPVETADAAPLLHLKRRSIQRSRRRTSLPSELPS